ncbi:hypothetical protein [Chitinophaga sancti]|uniref:hypothetical protein n=1 Tax=Chitinophaga sancti TaxID=1004 RepID=UPI003F7B003F
MRHIPLIALMMLSLKTMAQVSMTVQLPPTGVMQKAQLWNILLVSASSSQTVVHLELRITDAQNNQPILTGVSRAITLNKGAKQIQAGDVTPVTYEYLSSAADRSANGLLTAGSYIACYSLIQSTGDASNVVAENCLPFNVEPVAPPLLNTPADLSIVEGNLPQFSWLPPAPLSIFSDLNYDVTIVELRRGQSPAEAIQQNIPVYRSAHNKTQFLNYPVSAEALDTSKKYAWTVIANNGNQFAAQTDIWTFKIKGVVPEATISTQGAYIQLKKGLDVAQFSSNGTLQIGYNNDAGDTTVKYEIVALYNKNAIVKSGTLSLSRGQNLLQVTLDAGSMTSGQRYLFHLLNGRNEYWNAKFVYNKK